jgi:hypothetical protein
MSEMKKDFERLENEKFEKISKDCPWNQEFCEITDRICKKEECGIWHFLKFMV